jgi:hypothetical protein
MVIFGASGPDAARRMRWSAAISAVLIAAAAPAHADKIENQVAVFSALDKVTATIKKLEVPLGSTVDFGALKVTPRTCFSRPPTETPKTTSFVDVEEIQLDGQQKKIFSGWMFAESPGLNAVEHPVFDVWLTGCEKPVNAVASSTAAQPGLQPDADAGAATGTGEDFPRRRARR